MPMIHSDDDISDKELEAQAVQGLWEDMNCQYATAREATTMAAFLGFGAQVAQASRLACNWAHQTYLTHPELMPHPHLASPWLSLYNSQEDHRFITTMGMDTATFNKMLDVPEL